MFATRQSLFETLINGNAVIWRRHFRVILSHPSICSNLSSPLMQSRLGIATAVPGWQLKQLRQTWKSCIHCPRILQQPKQCIDPSQAWNGTAFQAGTWNNCACSLSLFISPFLIIYYCPFFLLFLFQSCFLKIFEKFYYQIVLASLKAKKTYNYYNNYQINHEEQNHGFTFND